MYCISLFFIKTNSTDDVAASGPLCCYGIYSWSKPNEQQKKLKISLLKVHWRIVIGIIIIVAGLLWARFWSIFRNYFPKISKRLFVRILMRC